MKKFLPASLFVLALAAPALADDAYWPGEPRPGADNNGNARAVFAGQAVTYDPWNSDFVPFGASAAATAADTGGQHPLTADELNRQLAVNRAYHQALRSRLIAEGGVHAPVLPLWAAEGTAFNQRAFGSPVMSGDQ